DALGDAECRARQQVVDGRHRSAAELQPEQAIDLDVGREVQPGVAGVVDRVRDVGLATAERVDRPVEVGAHRLDRAPGGEGAGYPQVDRNGQALVHVHGLVRVAALRADRGDEAADVVAGGRVERDGQRERLVDARAGLDGDGLLRDGRPGADVLRLLGG